MEQIKIHKIIRSKRRTVALVISPDAALTVRAPMRLPLDYIEKLVSKKSSWIKRKISDIQSRPKTRPKEFVDGEEFLYLGEAFRLKIVDEKQISIGEYLYFPRSMLLKAKENLKEWYKSQIKQRIEERIAWYARQAGVDNMSIAITGAQKRWGSCANKSSLNFSWRLAMAPLEVIDCVLAHELAHIKERNHSANFWCKVRALIPDYKKHVSWLKANEHLLHI
ncbi:MAG: M48 family metallopeptidase [Candidatus Omnitrophica bacterium]|jgi:hypothetical protein|nr:M48 family metallopeptidase [Candidatus Omnitrophota bacterium]